MKKITLAILILVLIQIAAALPLKECGRFMQPKDIPCNIITSWKPSTGCNTKITIFNSSGDIIQVGNFSLFTPKCNYTMNISTLGTFNYNSTIQDGVWTTRGDDATMIFSITIFLLLINGVLFILPFKTKFTASEAGNYMVSRLMWMAALLVLWFNTTLFRQLALDWGLGIDNFLWVYWWVFTITVWIVIFSMCYIMVVGTRKLVAEAQMRKRMGQDEQG